MALNVASTTCCGLFLLYLPLRIRQLPRHKKLEWGWLFLSKMASDGKLLTFGFTLVIHC